MNSPFSTSAALDTTAPQIAIVDDAPYRWSASDVERLLRAYAAGGRRAAQEAFPAMRPAQVFNAIRRYAEAPHGAPSALLSRPEIRARIAAIPAHELIDRIYGLVTWSPLRTTQPLAQIRASR